MEALKVWHDFQNKLRQGTFSAADCQHHRTFDYAAFLGSEKGTSLKKVILATTEPTVEWGEDKLIFTLQMGGIHQLRLDFKVDDSGWRFHLLDGLTIPIRSMPPVPLTVYPSAPFEARMRMEDVVTRRVFLYLKLRDRIGKPEALEWFRDGTGFRLNIESWMPYFALPKAFVLFVAWRENRYWGQAMSVEALDDSYARVVFREHEEMMLYAIAGHFSPRISLAEYREAFEDPWYDRAAAAGWRLRVEYDKNDTVFHLSALGT